VPADAVGEVSGEIFEGRRGGVRGPFDEAEKGRGKRRRRARPIFLEGFAARTYNPI